MQIESLPLDFFPAGIYTFDRKKRITSWNLALAQQTGFGSAEMIGKDASQIQYYDMEESTFDLFRCIRSGGKPFLSRTLFIKDAEAAGYDWRKNTEDVKKVTEIYKALGLELD